MTRSKEMRRINDSRPMNRVAHDCPAESLRCL